MRTRRLLALIYFGIVTSLTSVFSQRTDPIVVEDAEFWKKQGRETIEASLNINHNHGIAKNIILFIGDGMGLSTVTAGRIFKGQQEGGSGEESYLSFEKFPNVGLLKTYNIDKQVPVFVDSLLTLEIIDSAGTATALLSGVKANYYTIGFDSTVTFNTCRTDIEEKAKVTTLIDWGIEAEKSTGIVTNTRITHATPAAAYAHTSHREWECDTSIPETEKDCKDIARQLVENEPGRNINVILGGGRQALSSQVNSTSACKRGDGKELVWEWMQYQKKLNRSTRYISNRHQLLDVDDSVDYLLGLFADNHIPFDKDRDQSLTGQPSLEEMTAKAIQVLSRNPKGFVLVIEGGRIDHAHHDNLALVAMEEVVALDKAIEKALNMTDPKDTLIVVTADHSHSLTINGYPKRGNPIQGISDATPEGFLYETLSYSNGPGYTFHRVEGHSDKDNRSTSTINTFLSLNDSSHHGIMKQNASKSTEGTGIDDHRKIPHFAGFWMDWETHGGEDVPVYALGPMAHLFHSVHEQTHVSYVIAYSLCIGPYLENCREPKVTTTPSVTLRPAHSSSGHFKASSLSFYQLTFFLMLLTQILWIELNY